MNRKEIADAVSNRASEIRISDTVGNLQARKLAVRRIREELEKELEHAVCNMDKYGIPELVREATRATATLALFNSVYR